MTMYLEGYQFYVEKCNLYGLQPLSLRYYVKQLSPQQLAAFNTYAQKKKEC